MRGKSQLVSYNKLTEHCKMYLRAWKSAFSAGFIVMIVQCSLLSFNVMQEVDANPDLQLSLTTLFLTSFVTLNCNAAVDEQECQASPEDAERRLELKANDDGSLSWIWPTADKCKPAVAEKKIQSECCYEWVDETATGAYVTQEPLPSEYVDQILGNPVRLFRRNDHLPFYASFDFNVDQYGLRRNANKYNMTTRYNLVSKQTIEHSLKPLELHDFNTSRMFGLGESKIIAEHMGLDSSWIYAAGLGFSFHSRYSIGEVYLHILKGSLTALLTPISDLAAIREFPSTHPLHSQTQNDMVNSRKHKVQAQVVQLKAGDRLHIPHLVSYRLILQEDNTIYTNSDKWSNSTLLGAKSQSMENLPRYLQPSALIGEPLFFGMWVTAIYTDALLGITDDRMNARKKFVKIRELVKDRYGVDSIKLGHADDWHDYGYEGEMVMESVEAECEEMKHSPKDLMIQERDKVEEEVLAAAHRTRGYILQASKSYPQIVFQSMVLNQMEIIISHIIGGKSQHCPLFPVVLVTNV